MGLLFFWRRQTRTKRRNEATKNSGGGDDGDTVSDTNLSYFDDKDCLRVQIEQPKDGFFCTLNVVGKVPLPPKKVFDILTQEKGQVFRSIKRVNYRKEIKDDGHGRKKTEVEHVGIWKFGPIKGEFVVRMMVDQDRNRGHIKFRLLKSSLMKDFSGEWTIEPYDQDALDEMVRYPNKQWGAMHYLTKAVHRFEESLMHSTTSSLVQLRQSVQPKLLPPAPLDRVLKQITLYQVKTIMKDLCVEAERIKALPPANASEVPRLKDIGHAEGEHDDRDKGSLAPFCKKLFW